MHTRCASQRSPILCVVTGTRWISGWWAFSTNGSQAVHGCLCAGAALLERDLHGFCSSPIAARAAVSASFDAKTSCRLVGKFAAHHDPQRILQHIPQTSFKSADALPERRSVAISAALAQWLARVCIPCSMPATSWIIADQDIGDGVVRYSCFILHFGYDIGILSPRLLQNAILLSVHFRQGKGGRSGPVSFAAVAILRPRTWSAVAIVEYRNCCCSCAGVRDMFCASNHRLSWMIGFFWAGPNCLQPPAPT